jgi:hypothetical protein
MQASLRQSADEANPIIGFSKNAAATAGLA